CMAGRFSLIGAPESAVHSARYARSALDESCIGDKRPRADKVRGQLQGEPRLGVGGALRVGARRRESRAHAIEVPDASPGTRTVPYRARKVASSGPSQVT